MKRRPATCDQGAAGSRPPIPGRNDWHFPPASTFCLILSDRPKSRRRQTQRNNLRDVSAGDATQHLPQAGERVEVGLSVVDGHPLPCNALRSLMIFSRYPKPRHARLAIVGTIQSLTHDPDTGITLKHIDALRRENAPSRVHRCGAPLRPSDLSAGYWLDVPKSQR